MKDESERTSRNSFFLSDSSLILHPFGGNARIERGLTTERPIMSDNHGAPCDRDIRLENLAAELTHAAYGVALRHGLEDRWLDLELELWKALEEAVKKWGQEPPHFADVPFVCDWVGEQSEVAPVDIRDGLGHFRDARWPLSGE